MTFPLELNFNFFFFNVEIFLKERKTTKSHLETPMPSHLANEIVFSIGEKKKKSEKENMRVERSGLWFNVRKIEILMRQVFETVTVNKVC